MISVGHTCFFYITKPVVCLGHTSLWR